jgi:hypothetical protein
MKRPGLSIHENAIEALSQYDWAGNVRKLANVIERGVVLARGDTISADDLTLEAAHTEWPIHGNDDASSIPRIGRTFQTITLARSHCQRRRKQDESGSSPTTRATSLSHVCKQMGISRSQAPGQAHKLLERLISTTCETATGRGMPFNVSRPTTATGAPSTGRQKEGNNDTQDGLLNLRTSRQPARDSSGVGSPDGDALAHPRTTGHHGAGQRLRLRAEHRCYWNSRLCRVRGLVCRWVRYYASLRPWWNWRNRLREGCGDVPVIGPHYWDLGAADFRRSAQPARW